jgi:methylated-DNA-[protein]-cysteine S-methyltransferase
MRDSDDQAGEQPDAGDRAVGSALGRNPVPVLIPCHRVTRSDGAIGDYAFGSDTKESLLRAEEVDLDEVRELARGNVFYLGSDTTGIVCFPTCRNARRITPEHRHGFRSITRPRRPDTGPACTAGPGWRRSGDGP